MHPYDLISRLKRNTFSGFSLKEKHMRELVQIIEDEAKNKQQLLSTVEKSKSTVHKLERENHQLKAQIEDLSTKLGGIHNALKDERKLNTELEEHYIALSKKYEDLKARAAAQYSFGFEERRRFDEKFNDFKLRAAAQYELDLERQRQSDKKLSEITADLNNYKQLCKSFYQSASKPIGRSTDHLEKALAEIGHNYDFVAKAFDSAKERFGQGVFGAIRGFK